MVNGVILRIMPVEKPTRKEGHKQNNYCGLYKIIYNIAENKYLARRKPFY
jgi:hypothetical protein